MLQAFLQLFKKTSNSNVHVASQMTSLNIFVLTGYKCQLNAPVTYLQMLLPPKNEYSIHNKFMNIYILFEILQLTGKRNLFLQYTYQCYQS